MAETANTDLTTSATNVEKSKKVKKTAVSGAVKKPKSKPTHPPTAQMVNNAIKSLKERGGSSLPAIKKYLTANYKVDAEKLAPFIKKYLKNAVASGNLIQTKGKGASGSFKLPSSAKVKSESGSGGKKKSTNKKVEKKPKEKTAKTEKKKNEKKVEKKKTAVSAAKSAKKLGSPKVKPSKTKQQKPKKEKAAKATPKSPKPPKPKKLTAPKKTTAKKVAKK